MAYVRSRPLLGALGSVAVACLFAGCRENLPPYAFESSDAGDAGDASVAPDVARPSDASDAAGDSAEAQDGPEAASLEDASMGDAPFDAGDGD
jgi:hypothetical protein